LVSLSSRIMGGDPLAREFGHRHDSAYVAWLRQQYENRTGGSNQTERGWRVEALNAVGLASYTDGQLGKATDFYWPSRR
jgi:hypothetical protein